MTVIAYPDDRLSQARPPITSHAVKGLARMHPQQWDALLPSDDCALRHSYLTAFEECELPGLRSRPLVAYQEGEAVAACPGYLYKLDLAQVRFPAAGGALHGIRRLWPGFLHALTYELGSPLPLTNPFLVKDESRRPEAVKELITEGLEEGRRSGAQFLMVQNFTSLSGPAAEELCQLGFAGVPALPTAVVDLSFESFDDYLAGMRAQYRRRARQAFKRSKDLRVEHLDDFAGVASELARLCRLVYERAREIKREIHTPQYFLAMSRLKDASVLLTRRSDGSIASFALLLTAHPWLSFLQCGFDDQVARSEGAYFRLLYEIVRVGIEGGFRQLELGLTTLEPKLDIGGVPVPLFAWVKHRNPVIQRLLRAAANGPMRSQQLEPRRVFKVPPPDARELVAPRLR